MSSYHNSSGRTSQASISSFQGNENNSSLSKWYTAIVLAVANLVSFMDRFTLASVLSELQKEFGVGDDMGGMVQTIFIVFFMLFAPLFGYLGDRYSRRFIMVMSIGLWSGSTFCGSYAINFKAFLVYRGLVGIGETAFATVAPSTISDLFVLGMRSKMLALFYFATPVGSGLGYIVGSRAALAADNWRWSMRVTPFIGFTVLILLMLTIDPQRGESEGTNILQASSYGEDLKYLAKNRTYILTTAAYVCVAFVLGTVSWWAPTFIYIGLQLQSEEYQLTKDDVSFIFGIITMLAGIIGVPLGSFLSQVSIKRFPRVDPVVCSMGLFISAPMLAGALIRVKEDVIDAFILTFFGQLGVSLNWAIVVDIMLYVIIPNRRASAAATQIFFVHVLGDAFSPYFIGLISEHWKVHLHGLNVTEFIDNEALVKFRAMQYSLFSTVGVEILGGVLFLLAAFYIIKDRRAAKITVRAAHLVTLKAALSKSTDD